MWDNWLTEQFETFKFRLDLFWHVLCVSVRPMKFWKWYRVIICRTWSIWKLMASSWNHRSVCHGQYRSHCCNTSDPLRHNTVLKEKKKKKRPGSGSGQQPVLAHLGRCYHVVIAVVDRPSPQKMLMASKLMSPLVLKRCSKSFVPPPLSILLIMPGHQ